MPSTHRHDDIGDQQVEPLDLQRLQRLLAIFHIRHGKPACVSDRVTKVRTATSSSATRTRGTVGISDAAVIGVAHDRIRENLRFPSKPKPAPSVHDAPEGPLSAAGVVQPPWLGWNVMAISAITPAGSRIWLTKVAISPGSSVSCDAREGPVAQRRLVRPQRDGAQRRHRPFAVGDIDHLPLDHQDGDAVLDPLFRAHMLQLETGAERIDRQADGFEQPCRRRPDFDNILAHEDAADQQEQCGGNGGYDKRLLGSLRLHRLADGRQVRPRRDRLDLLRRRSEIQVHRLRHIDRRALHPAMAAFDATHHPPVPAQSWRGRPNNGWSRPGR